MYIDHLNKLGNLTTEEREFISDVSKNLDHQGVSLPRAISELYLAKMIELNVDKLIESNSKSARAMQWLTWALVIAAFAQVIVMVIPLTIK